MNKTYTSPALWTPEDPEIVQFTKIQHPDPDTQSYFCEKEAESRNAKIKKSAIGENTGWPSKWADEINKEPKGAEWIAARREAYAVILKNGIVILHGKRGCGKTRMAADIALALGQSRYRTAMRFFLEIRACFKDDKITEMEIIDDLKRAELLIIDELQERGDTPFEDRLLTHLIDARYAENKPTILIANLTRQELQESLGTSIVDRIRENGKTIEFNWLSFRGIA
jgi:DNA replication protein DnaC